MNKENGNYNAEYGSIEEVALTVSEWTKAAGTMLPKDPEQIKDLLIGSVTVQVWSFGREPELVGFGAVTFDWPGGWKELGCVIVKPGYREAGLGHKIVKSLIEKAHTEYPEHKLFALCNDKSLKIFLDNGAEVITDPGVLPKEVFEECVSCPMNQLAKSQGKMCCDTPVVIK